ncbi:hypothetical protein HanPSC8_Chr14g0606801 [Helianthus annuus]|nr:hypothetical protein HanPSC8_Chr14g0606801 [Helianthus annuus]
MGFNFPRIRPLVRFGKRPQNFILLWVSNNVEPALCLFHHIALLEVFYTTPEKPHMKQNTTLIRLISSVLDDTAMVRVSSH